MSEQNELLPCAHCGSTNITEKHSDPVALRWQYIQCNNCGASSMHSAYMDRAIAAWNRRVPASEPAVDRDAGIAAAEVAVTDALAVVRNEALEEAAAIVEEEVCDCCYAESEKDVAEYLATIIRAHKLAAPTAPAVPAAPLVAPQGALASPDDAKRLMFAMQDIDGFGCIEMDKYDYAIRAMEASKHDEITPEHELQGVRDLIDAAMRATGTDTSQGDA
ncbi:Lar family restriction alleviation protein [Massilia sp. PWRC2]|uniref:Lar family restriction alleviation protein n=1 Tax=Massilia sp. PWRC2 TaxID=2804626 RepID=UPI003CEB5BB7